MEKRGTNRKRLRLLVHAQPGDIRAYCGDISSTGLFLVSTKIHKPGTKIRLEISDKQGNISLGVGVVRWAKRVPSTLMRFSRGGMGVEFTWLSPEMKRMIEDIVE
ncbi:MAG: hypothetical protein C0609_12800 [Deltaproteobacteria bacterium]|nr:MAG: hypothetical protein C0609_12800 [Deltaproteobacteria bacterium]